ncbi:hypothetical protein B0O80DRAFT_249451 [Mortierella sp. GBAus27b]|nr:hypothetical protein B0O80DRAFT_249451 [Mortierella sp. GBAus27b]
MSTPAPPSPARQQPSGATRKHGKKKSRNSWKAGFKSTPSSPSQSSVDTRPSVLTELTPSNNGADSSSINNTKHHDSYTAHSNALSSADAAVKLSRPSTIAETTVEGVGKDDRQTQPQLQGKHVLPAKDSTLPNAGTSPRSPEFLQNLDIQLIKLQRDEERSQQSTTVSVTKEHKYPSGTSSISKSGSKVYEHELSQMLKTQAPAIARSESSQGT